MLIIKGVHLATTILSATTLSLPWLPTLAAEQDVDLKGIEALHYTIMVNYLAASGAIKDRDQRIALLNEGLTKARAEKFSLATAEKKRINLIVKLHTTVFNELQNSQNTRAYIDYAIAAHKELISIGYDEYFPSPIILAIWDCLNRKDYKTARELYTEVIKVAPGDLWVYPQTGLWDLDIKEHHRQLAAKQIQDFLSSDRIPKDPVAKRLFYILLQDTYKDLNDTAGVERMSKLLQDRHCPQCGSDKDVEDFSYSFQRDGTTYQIPVIHLGKPLLRCKKDNQRF